MNNLTNTNPDTGIRYGIISANSLCPDVVDELCYGPQAKDVRYEEALVEVKKDAEKAAEAVEEDVKIAVAERDYALLSNDTFMEKEVEAAYERVGFDSREDFIEFKTENEMLDWQCDEPIYEGTYEGVRYSTTWIGGAMHVWVFESPVTGHYAECSPCVPGAGNLDCPDLDGVVCYDVPDEWRVGDES